MSTNGVSSLVGRLNKTLGGYGKKAQGEKKENKDKFKYKFKKGNNHLLFLTPKGADDPFVENAYHKNLQEVDWYTVPCDEFNKNENCIVCNTVASLKKENFMQQMPVWKPIEQQIENWALVVDIETPESAALGARWAKISKTVMGAVVNWLENLEGDEVPFYDEEQPMKVIVSYDPDENTPAKKYACDKKYIKPYSAEQIQQWKDSAVPFSEVVYSKSSNNLKKLVEDYLIRVEDLATEAQIQDKEVTNEDKGSVEVSEPSDIVKKSTTSRLSSLKKS
jgi:hypothetical protein